MKDLMERRSRGDISTAHFYRGLLNLSRDVLDSLLKELEDGLDEGTMREHIPPLLIALREQINGLKLRGR